LLEILAGGAQPAFGLEGFRVGEEIGVVVDEVQGVGEDGLDAKWLAHFLHMHIPGFEDIHHQEESDRGS
jgi:hypothetical protein